MQAYRDVRIPKEKAYRIALKTDWQRVCQAQASKQRVETGRQADEPAVASHIAR